MTNEHDTWTDQLSEYLDEALEDARLRRMEEHLAGCATCRDVLADLRRVRDAARHLGESQPSRDLWPAIAASLGTSEKEADVIVLPVRSRAAQSPSGFFLTVRQLAAAAVVLVSMSAAATWWAGVGVATRQEAGLASGPAAPSAVSAVADVPGPSPELADDLRVLEEAVAEARTRLDPNTVRILERNLGVIQRAIDECLQALAVDPGNAFLLQHLERAYREKADFLRDAATIASWEG